MAPQSPPNESHIDTREFDPNKNAPSQALHFRNLLSDDGRLMSEVAQDIIDRDRRLMRREVTRVASFVAAVLCW